MNRKEIGELAARGTWNGAALDGTVIETHISWVILGVDTVFKIKRPVQFSFLDFSTLALRKHYCAREVGLNRRLTDIYLDVVPVHQRQGGLALGGDGTDPLDYAVRMRRMDRAFEMPRMLAQEQVAPRHIDALADSLAAFHENARVIHEPFDVDAMRRAFDDLESVAAAVKQRLGAGYAATIRAACNYSHQFLTQNRSTLAARVASGFRRDLHGDFHMGNVFLSSPPVIFDCIEFNDAMRRIDVLDEVAFLCMDLEASGHSDLADRFAQTWLQRMGLQLTAVERALFAYFRIYRAGVRAKVAALKDGEEDDWKTAARYLDYMRTQLPGPVHAPQR